MLSCWCSDSGFRIQGEAWCGLRDSKLQGSGGLEGGDAKVQAEFGYSELKLGLGSEQLSPVSLRAVAGCKVQGSREPHFSYLLEI